MSTTARSLRCLGSSGLNWTNYRLSPLNKVAGAPARERLYLGIDGGGSKCRACVADSEGTILGVGTAGPSNPLHGVEQTQESIVSAAESALRNADLKSEQLSQLVVGAGLAGVNLPSLYQVMSDWRHPFAAMYLTTDLRIACLGAHRRDDGAVIVTGTGSCGYVRDNKQDFMLGGHGFLFGDKGSGAWMGLEALKAILLADDALGPQTELSELIADYLQARGLAIVEHMSGRKPRDYAKLAPLVFSAAERGDAVASQIVKEGGRYISALAQKLLAHKPSRLSIIGGMAERLRPWLARDIAALVSEPLGPPEVGAVQYARQEQPQA